MAIPPHMSTLRADAPEFVPGRPEQPLRGDALAFQPRNMDVGPKEYRVEPASNSDNSKETTPYTPNFPESLPEPFPSQDASPFPPYYITYPNPNDFSHNDFLQLLGGNNKNRYRNNSASGGPGPVPGPGNENVNVPHGQEFSNYNSFNAQYYEVEHLRVNGTLPHPGPEPFPSSGPAGEGAYPGYRAQEYGEMGMNGMGYGEPGNYHHGGGYGKRKGRKGIKKGRRGPGEFHGEDDATNSGRFGEERRYDAESY